MITRFSSFTILQIAAKLNTLCNTQKRDVAVRVSRDTPLLARFSNFRDFPSNFFLGTMSRHVEHCSGIWIERETAETDEIQLVTDSDAVFSSRFHFLPFLPSLLSTLRPLLFQHFSPRRRANKGPVTSRCYQRTLKFKLTPEWNQRSPDPKSVSQLSQVFPQGLDLFLLGL